MESRREDLFNPASALLCIDMQNSILRGLGGAQQAEIDRALEAMLARVARLQEMARKAGIPVVHIQHDGAAGHRLERGGPGWPIRAEVAPLGEEAIVHKGSCDSFHDTTLAAVLEGLGVRALTVVGCMTQYCVDTTSRRAVGLGFDVTLVGDCHMNAGSAGLSYKQVIAHHNALLDGFDAGPHSVRVVSLEA